MKKPKVVINQNKLEVDLLKNQLVRVLADYDNLRKRVDSDRQDFEKFANRKLLIQILPILDALRQAELHLKDVGVAIIIKEFEEIIKKEGLEEIEVKEQDLFNEAYQEAVEVIEDKNWKGKPKVGEVLLSGWRFINGPVIRHAKVKVIKGEK